MTNRAVFLSYASQDADAARRICEALRAAGVEVWFDQSELRGGDSWDAKIRKQIRECALFVPVISASTQARREGYFRREWKQAAERTRDMADGTPFLVPVVIDATSDREALVPDEFRAVQWTRLPVAPVPAPDASLLSGPSAAAYERFCSHVRLLLGCDVPTVSGRPRRTAGRSSPARKRRVPIGAWAVALVVTAAVVGAWRWKSAGASATEPPLRAKAADKTIAVLPFENRSDDRGNEYFSDGISDEILNLLGKIAGLRVAGRASAFAFKGKNVSDAEIARTLGVTYVVNGSVQKVGTQVRIVASLSNATDGTQIWSDSFTKELTDILALQDEIARLIAQRLQLNLGAVRPARRVNPEAYRLALEGRHFWQLRTEEAFARAEAAFRRALEIDPDFADAHVGLASVWAVRGWYAAVDGANATEDFARARAEAQIALRLEPMMVEAHAVLGAIHFNEGRFGEAERAYQIALQQNPNDALVHHWRAHVLGANGRIDLSCAELELAARLDPLSFITLVIFAMHLEAAGRDAESLAICDRAIALRSDMFVPVHATRAMVLWKLGRTREAVDEARRVAANLSTKPRWWTDGYVVHVLRASGHEREASEHAERFLAGLPENSRVRAPILAATGKVDEALDVLEQIAPSPSAYLPIYGSAFWARARQHPRFAGVIDRLGRTDQYATFQAITARTAKETVGKK